MPNMNKDITISSTTHLLKEGDGLCWWRRRRYLICLLTFFGYFICYCFRVNLSIAIVAMTKPLHISTRNNNTTNERAEFDWDPILQGYILSSYYYGYTATMLLGGWLSSRFGGHLMMAESVGIPSIVILCTPLLTKLDSPGLILSRVLVGFFASPSSTATHDLWARWAPASEKSWLITCAYTGTNIGTMFMLTIGGVISDSLGWPYLFYIPGFLGVLWTIVWLLIVRNSPELDKKINPKELNFLKREQITCQNNSKVVIPWKSIFTSSACWSHFFYLVAVMWFFNTLHTHLPRYISDVLKIDIRDVGYMSAIPYVTFAIILPLSGLLADRIISNRKMNITLVRKLWTAVGFLGQSFFLMIQILFVNQLGIGICLALCFLFHGVITGVMLTNPLDLSRRHASVIYGISASCGCLVAILGPIITGYITQTEDISGWMIVFSSMSVISILVTIIFCIYGSGEEQSWAK